jgi:hypothetical protein
MRASAPGYAAWMRGGCVVEVRPLLRELILAAVDVPLDYAHGSRREFLMQLLLADLATIPPLPLCLAWPTDAKLRTICDAIMASPDRRHAVAE